MLNEDPILRQYQIAAMKMFSIPYSIEDARHVVERIRHRCEECYKSGTVNYDTGIFLKDLKELNRIAHRNLIEEGKEYSGNELGFSIETGKIEFLPAIEQKEGSAKSAKSYIQELEEGFKAPIRMSGWINASDSLPSLAFLCMLCKIEAQSDGKIKERPREEFQETLATIEESLAAIEKYKSD